MRFVVLHHTQWPGRNDHYDLMIEHSEGNHPDDLALKTYATTTDIFPGNGSTLQAISDHRRAYLTLEGPLSNDRGTVTRVDEGECIPSPSGNGFRAEFKGRKLRGKFWLQEHTEGIRMHRGP
jgi:hypothetical protein